MQALQEEVRTLVERWSGGRNDDSHRKCIALGDGTGAALTVEATGLVDLGTLLKQWFGSRSCDQRTVCRNVTLADGDTATNLAGAVTLDGLNWSGYDGLTTGALTLSTAAVDINSQGGNIQFASIAGGSQDLSLNAGVAAGTTTVTGNVLRWETEPERSRWTTLRPDW